MDKKDDKKPLKGSKKAARFLDTPAVTVRQKKVAKAVARTPRKTAAPAVPTARVRRQTALAAARKGY